MTYQPLTFDFSDDFTTTENGSDALGYLVDPPSISATNENGDGSLVARVRRLGPSIRDGFPAVKSLPAPMARRDRRAQRS